MLHRLRLRRYWILGFLVAGFLVVTATHSEAMKTAMAAEGACTVQMKCCDCTVPEIPQVQEAESTIRVWTPDAPEMLPPPLPMRPPIDHPPK